MKIKNISKIIAFSLIYLLHQINVEASQGNNDLNKQLEELVLEDDFPELYNVEPMTDEELKSNKIPYSIRRHQNNKILEQLEKKDNIEKFLSKKLDK